MNCEDVMDALDSLCLGELDDREADGIKEHLESCKLCSMELELLEKIYSAASDCASYPYDRHRIESLWERVHKDIVNQKSFRGEPFLMSPMELASYLNVPLRIVHELRAELPVIKLGNCIRFRRSSIDDWLERRESGNMSEGFEKISSIRY